jgi:hypothetical protein
MSNRRGRTAPPPLNPEETMEPIPENPGTPPVDVQEFQDPPGPSGSDRETSVLPTSALTSALELLTGELRRRENPGHKAKTKEPDTFDGSDTKKLNNFILLCNLYFRANPSSYSDDDAKVTFALSYLRGLALEYFEPALLDSEVIPDWLEDWPEFTRVLRTQFGPIDPTADAEDGIDNLRMQDNQHIVKYNVEFNRLAIRTRWDDSVLRHRYYSGLAERIKDIMGQQGKPPTLESMKALAHSIDSRHWERLREKSRTGKAKSDKAEDKKPDDKNKGQSSGNNSNNSSNPAKNKKGKFNNDNKSGKPPSASGSSSSIADKLGKDGKLTHQERQRRFDNNLCMFCGGAGHTAKECPKSTSSASKAKARAVEAKEKETPDPKKG